MKIQQLAGTAFVLVLGVATAAHASESAADAAARKALLELVPQAKIDAVEAAPIPGFRQIIVGGQLVYVSDDGKYLLQGTLFDAKAQSDLTAARLAVENKRKIDAVPASERIVFAPSGKPRHRITVFTDIDCGYCRKLHAEVAELNQRGIEVDYLFFPRSGPGTPSFRKAEAVWCSKSPKATFTEAKAGGLDEGGDTETERAVKLLGEDYVAANLVAPARLAAKSTGRASAEEEEAELSHVNPKDLTPDEMAKGKRLLSEQIAKEKARQKELLGARCENPVARQFELGTQVGVSGTPTILAEDGSKIGGYLPPDAMLSRLEALGKAKLAGS